MHLFSWKQQRFRSLLYIVFTALAAMTLLFNGRLGDKDRTVVSHHSNSSRVKSPKQETPYIYPFLVDGGHVCSMSTKPPELVVFVASAPGHRRERDAIRSTWASPSYLQQRGIKVVFMVGHSAFDSHIFREAEEYRDIIQGAFADTYENLTLKTVMMLQWTQSFCPEAPYVMKTDDDVYVNLDYVLHHLHTVMTGRRRWVQGCVKQHVGQPILTRDGKPVGPASIHLLPRGHPRFVAGAGYIVSGDIVGELLRASAHTRWVPLEDVFLTGMCTRRIGVVPETDDRFSCGRSVGHPCELRHMFTGHGVTPDLMRAIWDAMPSSCT